MTPELESLGRRAIACKGWRWVPGMLHRNWRNSTRVTEDHAGYMWDGWPDLSDPATLGCLMALVREVREDPLICAYVDNTGCGWWLDGWADSRLYGDLHDTEAAALVAALEAAP